jgi:hypothetical protein
VTARVPRGTEGEIPQAAGLTRDVRWLLGSVVLLSAVPFLVSSLQPGAQFSPDSWSYYDLAQTVFGDFYHPAVTRSHHEIGGYSQSFPLLWPVLIAVGARASGLRLATQVVLASVFSLLTILPLYSIAKTLLRHRGPAVVVGIVAWVCLACFPAYRDEVVGGRSIPLAIFLLTSAVALVIRPSADRRPGLCAGAGLLLGAACLARFDSLIVSLVLVLAFVARSKVGWPCRVAIIVAFAVGVSPWVAYSELRYGTAWASDNSLVASSAEPSHAQNASVPAATIRTSPGRWLVRVGKNAVRVGMSLLLAVVSFPLALATIAGALIVGWTPPKSGGAKRVAMPESPAVRLFFAIVAACCGLAALALTGYYDPRYFAFACVMLLLWSGATLVGWTGHRRVLLRGGIAAAGILAVGAAWIGYQSLGAPQMPGLSEREMAVLRRDFANATILDRSDWCFASGALSRVHIVCAPQDWDALTLTEKQALVRRQGVTHVRIVPLPAGEPRIVPVDEGLIALKHEP